MPDAMGLGGESVVSGAAGAVSGVGGSSDEDMGEAGAAGDPQPQCQGGHPVTPELVISDLFFPGGYGALDWVELLQLAECPTRAPGALGACYAFEWTPYQRPYVYLAWIHNDAWDPICLESGAKTLRFSARGEHAGQLAKFGFLSLEREVQLTGEWQQFEIDISAIDYARYVEPSDELHRPGVNVGFWMVLDHPEQGIQRVFVDDIQLVAPVVQCLLPSDVPSECAEPPGAPPFAPGWCAPDPGRGEAEPDPTLPMLLVDDLEDGDALSLPLPAGRAIWAAYNDGTPGSAQYPRSECPLPTQQLGTLEGGELAMRTAGCGVRRWGAGLQLLFGAGPPDCASAFDASSYDGVEFWLSQSDASAAVTLQLNTSGTVPAELGGSCTADCFNSYQNAHELANGWNRVSFLELRQLHEPRHLLNPATIRSVGWAVPPSSSFDFSVDNVRFFRQ
jgi:hypothetical protein